MGNSKLAKSIDTKIEVLSERPAKTKDLCKMGEGGTGKFGSLQVIKYHGRSTAPSGSTASLWECQCKCGNMVIVKGAELTSEARVSCSTACAHEYHAHKRIGEVHGKYKLTSCRKTSNGFQNVYMYSGQCMDCGNIKETLYKYWEQEGINQHCEACRVATTYDKHVDKKFGKLLVTGYNYVKGDHNRYMFNCKCDCGNISIVKPYDVLTGDTTSCGCHFLEVKREAFTGEGSPTYKGGITPELIRARTDPRMRRCAIAAKARDNSTCMRCGYHAVKKNVGLEAHHLFNFKDYPHLRYEVDNCITLCCLCHADFHAKYGKVMNTPEQIKEHCANKPQRMSTQDENCEYSKRFPNGLDDDELALNDDSDSIDAVSIEANMAVTPSV